jgi:hypothetical protein
MKTHLAYLSFFNQADPGAKFRRPESGRNPSQASTQYQHIKFFHVLRPAKMWGKY